MKPQPMGPFPPTIGDSWRALRRQALEQAVTIEAYGLPEDGRGTVVAANHTGVLDVDVIRAAWPSPLALAGRLWAIRRGTSALVFPERGTSPDGTLGTFHPEVFDDVVAAWRRGSEVTVTPLAISGTHDVGRQLPWWRSPSDKARVVLRAGAPIGPGTQTTTELAEQVRAAVVALLAEDAGTWWQVQQGTAPEPSTAPTWRESWRRRGDEPSPGEQRPGRIWG